MLSTNVDRRKLVKIARICQATHVYPNSRRSIPITKQVKLYFTKKCFQLFFPVINRNYDWLLPKLGILTLTFVLFNPTYP